MDYRPIVRERAQALGIDPNLAEAVLVQESGGNPSAVSPAGAVGLMQLMPGTAKELGVDPRVPEQNIDGGLRYLKQQIDKFGVAGGLAAYNAGPGRVQRTGMQFDALPSETRNYVPSIMNRAAMIAERSGGQSQPTQQRPTAMDIPTLLGGYQKATAANDTEAVAEIGGLIKQRYQDALSKAQAANDTEAVAEIQGAMQQFGAPAPAPAPVAQAAPAAAASKPTPQPKKEEPRSVLRRVDDFVRGVADTVTFGYADELAAKADAAVRGTALDNFLKRNLGVSLSQSGASTYQDAVAAQRQRDAEGGVERIAGQVGGAFVPGAAAVGAVRAVPTAGRLARAGAGAATGAIQGGLYGSGSAEEGQRLEGAAKGAAFGAATGGILGGVMPATVSQKADDAIRGAKKKGTLEELRIQSEIAQDFKKVAQNPNLRELDDQGLPTIATALRNQQNDTYVDKVVSAIKRVEPDLLKRFDVETALKQEKIIGPDDLQRMRSMSNNGQLLADSIEKYQIARTMTAPTPASGSLGAKTARFVITNAPRAASAAAGASSMGPMGLALGAITPGAKGFAERVTGKMTVPERIEKLAKNADVFAEILKREGGSQITKNADTLFEAARRAEAARSGQKAAAQVTRQAATDAAEQLRIRNLQLGVRSNPGFQPENLQITGGTRGTLQYYGRLADSKELAKGLRLIEKTDPYLAPYIKHVQQNKNVPNKEILLGLTDRLKLMRDQGILKPYIKQ